MWQEAKKSYIRRGQCLDDNMRDIFSVVWGQCSTSMQSKIKQLDEYNDMKSDADCAWLINQVKDTIYKCEDRQQKFFAMMEARSNLETCRQHEKESDCTFFDQFKALVESFEHYGGIIDNDIGLIEELEDTNDADHPGEMPTLGDGDEVRRWVNEHNKYQSRMRKISRDRCIGMMFLKKSDKIRYGDLWASLQNQFTRGNDQYPEDITSAYNMITSHKQEYHQKRNRQNKEDEDEVEPGGLSFCNKAQVYQVQKMLHMRM